MMLLLILLAACNSAPEIEQPTANAESAAAEPAAIATAVPSTTPVPAETRVPTAPPEPSATPQPTKTASSPPTAVPAATEESTPVATAGSPLTLRINADGSGDLPTLAEAVAFAAGGSTIELSAGEFALAQTLNIDKPLAISGAGMDQTTILSDAPFAAVNYDGGGLLSLHDLTISHSGAYAADIISVRAGEIDLADCRVQGAVPSADGNYGAGLFVLNDAAAKVINCEFAANRGVGVEINHEAQITFEDSVISGNRAGILFDGSSSGLVSGTVIEANDEGGIFVFALARPEIVGNVIQDNAGYGIRYQLDDDVGGTVEGNELLNNNIAGQGATGTDIVIFDAFVPHLSANICRGGEGLALASGGPGVAADPSGIIFFNTAIGRADIIAPQDNDCALAFCSLSPGTADFQLQCENPG